MMSMNPNSIAILIIHSVDYSFINGINKSEIINLLKNDDLHEKSESL